jgi:3-dehydroquinate synthase
MCSPQIMKRLLPIYDKLNLPSSCRMDLDAVCGSMLHDKKSEDGKITIVETDRIGSYRMRTADPAELREKAAMVIR